MFFIKKAIKLDKLDLGEDSNILGSFPTLKNSFSLTKAQ